MKTKYIAHGVLISVLFLMITSSVFLVRSFLYFRTDEKPTGICLKK